MGLGLEMEMGGGGGVSVREGVGFCKWLLVWGRWLDVSVGLGVD